MITLNLLALAIGIGLLVTLLVTEAFGIAAGGLIVPGYIALTLMQPVNLAITIVVALLTFAIVRVSSSFMVLYGRRMTGLTILTAYLIGALLELTIGGGIAFDFTASNPAMQADTGTDALNQSFEPVFVELGVVGYIIPGLIALWFNRQGVIQTLSALAITSVLVRLVLIVVIPDVMIAHDAGQLSFIDLLAQLLGDDGAAPIQ